MQKYKSRNRNRVFERIHKSIRSTPKQIKLDNGGAFISKKYKDLCKSQNIHRVYGTANRHTGTRLVEGTIQSLENLILANLEDGQNLRESVNRALHVLRFTVHSETKKTPFELHFGQTPRTKLSNLKKIYFSGLQRPLCVHHPKLIRTNHGPSGNVKEKDGRTKIQTRDDHLAKKPTSSISTNNFEYPFEFYEKNYKKESMESKFKNIL